MSGASSILSVQGGGYRRLDEGLASCAQISMTAPQVVRQCVCVDGVEYRVPPIPHAILAMLLVRRGQIVSVADLIEVIWPDPDNSPADEVGTFGVHIHRLRRALPGAIHNVWGRGYFMPLPREMREAA